MSCDGPACICRQSVECLYQGLNLRDTRRRTRRCTAGGLSCDREHATRRWRRLLSSAATCDRARSRSARRWREDIPVRGLPTATAFSGWAASGDHHAWLVWLRKPRAW